MFAWRSHEPTPAPVPERCGAPSERIHAHHPCPGCIPTVRVPVPYPPSHPQGCTPTSNPPGLHPGLICGAPSERIHPHHPCPGPIPTIHVPDAYPPSHPQGCTLGWYAALLQSASMPTTRVPDSPPPSVFRIHPHHPIPRVAPWADMRRSFRAHSCPPCLPQRGDM